MAATEKKVVFVGDQAAGLTTLILMYIRNEFPDEYIPTVFDGYEADLKVDGRLVHFNIWDTAGHKDYDKIHPLVYPSADVIVIGFSVDSHDSFKNILTRWTPEVVHFCPNIPILLVATKTDLRKDLFTLQKVVTPEQGRNMAGMIGAWGYFESSSVLRKGVKEVFENAARAALGDKKIHGKLKSRPVCSS